MVGCSPLVVDCSLLMVGCPPLMVVRSVLRAGCSQIVVGCSDSVLNAYGLLVITAMPKSPSGQSQGS